MQNRFYSLLVLGFILLGQMLSAQTPTTATTPRPFGLVIHGGAGTILRKNMTPEREASIRADLDRAMALGYNLLEQGGSAMDAVEIVIRYMEDSPNFNAGKGAVRTNEGKFELDASVMDGKTGMAGAVASVTCLKNPISAARAVMEKSRHVMLIGEGAESFAKGLGLETADSAYFATPERSRGEHQIFLEEHSRGTVGCVALDKDGNLAAGTSTGGTDDKLHGRVGDAPIIGAGTYCENGVVGVSATGHGEYFIRHAVAYDIAARMKYLKQSVDLAANEVIFKTLNVTAGEGGVICLDAQGDVSLTFNSLGMYRGHHISGKPVYVGIYKDE